MQVQLLLQGREHHVDVREDGRTALMAASWHGNREMVGLLCQLGACVNERDPGIFLVPGSV